MPEFIDKTAIQDNFFPLEDDLLKIMKINNHKWDDGKLVFEAEDEDRMEC